MAEAPRSLWQAELIQPPRGGSLPSRVEVLVVGGGISGVSLLRTLQARGVSVALVERERLGAGASGRNAGFLLTGVAANYAGAVARYGRRTAADVWRFTAENHRALAAAVEPRAVRHSRCGAWNVAESAAEAAALRESAELLAEDGLTGRWISPRSAPSWAPLGALVVDDDGVVDPLRTVEELAGPTAPVHEGRQVNVLEPGAGGVRVGFTDGSEVSAAQVVLATNAWTAQLVPEVPIRPVRAQMLCTEPVSPLADRPAYAGWGFRYFRQLPDGRLLIGGCRDLAVAEEVGFGLEPTAVVQNGLERASARLGVTARVQRRWAGTMGFSPDELPLAGELPGRPGVWVMGGYTGHGMGFAFHCAQVLAARICAGQPLPSWLALERLDLPRAGTGAPALSA